MAVPRTLALKLWEVRSRPLPLSSQAPSLTHDRRNAPSSTPPTTPATSAPVTVCCANVYVVPQWLPTTLAASSASKTCKRHTLALRLSMTTRRIVLNTCRSPSLGARVHPRRREPLLVSFAILRGEIRRERVMRYEGWKGGNEQLAVMELSLQLWLTCARRIQEVWQEEEVNHSVRLVSLNPFLYRKKEQELYKRSILHGAERRERVGKMHIAGIKAFPESLGLGSWSEGEKKHVFAAESLYEYQEFRLLLTHDGL